MKTSIIDKTHLTLTEVADPKVGTLTIDNNAKGTIVIDNDGDLWIKCINIYPGARTYDVAIYFHSGAYSAVDDYQLFKTTSKLLADNTFYHEPFGEMTVFRNRCKIEITNKTGSDGLVWTYQVWAFASGVIPNQGF